MRKFTLGLAAALCAVLALSGAAQAQIVNGGGGGGGGGTPCTSVALSLQFNNSGAFGCVTGMTFNAGTLTIPAYTVSGAILSNNATGPRISGSTSGVGNAVFIPDKANVNAGIGSDVVGDISLYDDFVGSQNEIVRCSGLACTVFGSLTANTGFVGPVSTSSVSVTGTTPTLTGTCTTGSKLGGSTAGSFTATCTAQTVIISPGVTATNGWICFATDITTPANTMKQNATATGSCTLTGTTAASDVIGFFMIAF